MTCANDREHAIDLLDVMSTWVLVGDGAMGTQPHAADVFNQVDGCDGILNETKYVRLQSG